MRKLYIGILGMLAACMLAACGDEHEQQNSWLIKNTNRVKEIVGHNSWWGDFSIVCSYQNEKLDSGRIYNGNRQKIGDILTEYQGNTIQFLIRDYVKSTLETGTGYVAQTLVDLTLTMEDQVVKSSEVKYYGPVNQQDNEESYTYELKKMIFERYEYDQDGHLIIVRTSGDPDLDEPLGKYEYNYHDGQLDGWTGFEYEGINWVAKIKAKLTYTANLSGISYFSQAGNWESDYMESFEYHNNVLSKIVTTGNKSATIDYQFNAEGYVTNIDYGNGNLMEIKYETGNGNFALLTPLSERIKGYPYIK